MCRALVPLGLPPLAGLARRPLLLAGRHTEHALKSLASSLGGPWRKVREGRLGPRGGSEGSSAKRAADWGEEVEPDYTGRPPAAWCKGARPISVVKRPSGPEETSRRPGGTPGAGPVGKQKHPPRETKETTRTGNARSPCGVTGVGVLTVGGSHPGTGSLSAGMPQLPVAAGGALRPAGRGSSRKDGATPKVTTMGKGAAAHPDRSALKRICPPPYPAAAAAANKGASAASGKKRGRSAPSSPE